MVVESCLEELVLPERRRIQVPSFRFLDVALQSALDRRSFRLFFRLEVRLRARVFSAQLVRNSGSSDFSDRVCLRGFPSPRGRTGTFWKHDHPHIYRPPDDGGNWRARPKYETKPGTCQYAGYEVVYSKEDIMAERQGFEPWLEFPLNTLSKRAPSATRPSLRAS